jgi:hypothetical protein
MDVSRPDEGFERPQPGWRRMLFPWLVLMVLGVANGVTRGLLYEDRMGELRAHQLSSVTLSAGVLAWTIWVQRHWSVRRRAALRVGAAWVALTVVFEFGFGHFLDHQSWSSLVHDYRLDKGRLWPIVLAVIGLAPAFAARAIPPAASRERRRDDGRVPEANLR